MHKYKVNLQSGVLIGEVVWDVGDGEAVAEVIERHVLGLYSVTLVTRSSLSVASTGSPPVPSELDKSLINTILQFR
jgi:hypothetical protein